MKDSNVGAFAAITLILLFLVKFVAISRIVEAEQLALIVPAFVLSRFAMVNMAVSLPYARQEGTGGAFVKGASLLHSVIAGVISLLIVAAFMQWQGLLILVLTLIVSFLLGLYFKKKIGGVTGDLLGATSEVIESLVLFATALFVNVL